MYPLKKCLQPRLWERYIAASETLRSHPDNIFFEGAIFAFYGNARRIGDSTISGSTTTTIGSDERGYHARKMDVCCATTENQLCCGENHTGWQGNPQICLSIGNFDRWNWDEAETERHRSTNVIISENWKEQWYPQFFTRKLYSGNAYHNESHKFTIILAATYCTPKKLQTWSRCQRP